MKYSVLIPTLNEERYIGTLLVSLVSQTHNDFEVIVADGNSEDGTEKVVRKFKDILDIRFFRSKKRGPGIQRNVAAKHARYSHLIFFDADVKPERHFLEKLTKAIKKNKLDAASAWNIPRSRKTLDKIFFAVVNIFVLTFLGKLIPTGVGTFIYMKKKVFKEIEGFDEEIVFAEDFELLRRLGERKRYKFAILRDPKIHFSVRRLDKEGRLRAFLKFAGAGAYYIIKGPIKDPKLFIHKFGKH